MERTVEITPVLIEETEESSADPQEETELSNNPSETSDTSYQESFVAEASNSGGYSTEFEKFLQLTKVVEAKSPEESFDQQVYFPCDWPIRHCAVDLVNLDIEFNLLAGYNMDQVKKIEESKKSLVPRVVNKEVTKRDFEGSPIEGPCTKKQKPDAVSLTSMENSPSDNKRPPEVTVITVKSKSDPKENFDGSVKTNKLVSGEEKRRDSKDKSDKLVLKKSNSDSSKKVESPQKSVKSVTPTSNADRTSLQCLEQKLLDLQKQSSKHQSKPKSSSYEMHSKTKTSKPSSKDSHHRRSEAFIFDRKKVTSPVKKLKKSSSSSSSVRVEDTMGSLFCPMKDSKVTILPCKAKEVKNMDAPPSASNSMQSVTITKLSTGNSLSIPAKDIKKVLTPKSETREQVVKPMSIKHHTFRLKGSSKSSKNRESKEERHREDKHRDRESKERRSREPSRDRHDKHRDSGGHEKVVGSIKIIRCSKCREVFSTKEAKKLHTCNSLLDAHYLIDCGDRQKISPASSESASLSRSSSRSSSPGGSVKDTKKLETKIKISKKLIQDGDDTKIAKMKFSLTKIRVDEDGVKVKDDDRKPEKSSKRDSLKEKWVEKSKETIKSDPDNNKSDGVTSLTIKPISSDECNRKHCDRLDEKSGKLHAASLEIIKMENKMDTKDEDMSTADQGVFAFSGKRTYSPSMIETTSVDGKGELSIN